MSTLTSCDLTTPGPSKSALRTTRITDHEGNDVNLIWTLRQHFSANADRPHPFPFQVYFTKDAEHSASNAEFRSDLVRLIEGQDEWDREPVLVRARFEFYTKPFPNVLCCIAHQRREVSYRNRNGVSPRLISDWGDNGGGYEGLILVVDRDDCLSAGLLLVHFDNEIHRRGRRQEWWYSSDSSPEVETVRQPMNTTRANFGLALELQFCHRRAGGKWTEDDLQRRNEGAASPVLYPAIDPDSRYDTDHEALVELDGTALPPPGDLAETGEDNGDDHGPSRIKDLFDRRELFMRDIDLPDLSSKAYTDLFDQPVISVWDRRMSKTRPDFSFILYVSYDVLPLQPKALFTCLNKGLLAETAWTLDVVTNMPSIEATFDYHTHSASLRSPDRLQARRSCIRLILDRINDKRLPVELLDLIEHHLVPPEIPNYSSRPLRLHQSIFMYLDGSHLSTGPLLIYSNRMDLRLGRNFCHPDGISEGSTDLDQNPLRVLFLRFWHRVADELHNVWSTCSPRVPLPGDQVEEPAEASAITHAKVSLRSNCARPITVHLHGLFSHDLWREALDIVDLSSRETLPLLPFDHDGYHDKGDSWLPTNELGFCRGYSPEGSSMITLSPSRWEEIPFRGGTKDLKGWILERRDSGLLLEGKEYALRLRDDMTIPRWTYGAAGEREGPYNLPALSVKMEREVEFQYEGKEVLTDRYGVVGPMALSEGPALSHGSSSEQTEGT